MISEKTGMRCGVCCSGFSAVFCMCHGAEKLILFYCDSDNEKYLPCQSNFQFKLSLGESVSVKMMLPFFKSNDELHKFEIQNKILLL